MASPAGAKHPGTRIKAEVIPRGMSVTNAAQIMGVGRPALSNLLNGKAALSADMAARLEKAFNFPLKDLMEMQARYDAAQAQHKDRPANTKAYVPPFLAIKANDIEEWCSNNIAARIRFAVFLRTLIHSTGSRLTKVDFPGNDDAERRGWDGIVEAEEGNPWVPAGRSGWEFGTSDDVKAKAEHDFEKSVRALKKEERTQTTFVFVTPRRWNAKTAWIATKRAKGLWKDVCAYDASDLEQWLEQSLPGQAWFADEADIPAQHVRSLDRCWSDWASVSQPALTGALFNSAIDAGKRTLLSRLSKPPERPILVVADSTGEALAFLSQLLGERGGEELTQYRDRVLVFDKPGILPRLATGANAFISVVLTREVERELAPHANSMHSIVVYPRNALTGEPDIVLEPASHETFSKALEQMGKDRDEVTRLANASGRSLTVLRRQLSTVPAVRTPEWASDSRLAASLVPFLCVGTWNSQNELDKFGLSQLAGGHPYGDLEKQCQSFARLDDPPVWSIGTYRGVISKIDLLHAIAGAITPDDLTRYFTLAREVLGEDDPKLDVEEGERWASSMRRKFSDAFREGISETLVLLAVHGNQLFKARIGVDTEIEAMRVVRDLLPTPLTLRVLEANSRDLPTYAEAAPDEFLSILERDLSAEDSAVRGLIRPVDAGVFGSSPSRVGVLWALESLSWNPVTLPRAASILARLAQVEIHDNWVNKPMHSLQSIFRAWMPQTAADHQQRVALMRNLASKFPDVAWKICIAQFGDHHQVGDYSQKPRWRADGYGFGEPFPTWGPVLEFKREMVEMALTWKSHSRSMLCDLVERLQYLTEADQDRAWKLLEAWARTASDADKAEMREKIRVSTLSRRAMVRAKKSGGANAAVAGKEAYRALEPSDLLNKHAWLFRSQWVEESAEEIEDYETIDYRERALRVEKLRIRALHEVLAQYGFSGVLELCKRGGASWVIGALLASAVLSEADDLQELIRLGFASPRATNEDVHAYENLVRGVMHAPIGEAMRENVIRGVAAGFSEENTVQLLVLAPYCRHTWKLVDELGDRAQSEYWDKVSPEWIRDCPAESSESIARLLKAERPRAAFSCMRFELDKADPQVLFRVLTEMAQSGKERQGQYLLEHYDVEKAFKQVSGCSTLTLEQKAGLELAYIDVLARPWSARDTYGIPNLERYIEEHPELFVQAVVWTYKRKDGASDPPEFEVPPERVDAMATRGYKLLEGMERIPGHNDLDDLQTERLAEWIAKVRQSCTELGRGDIADICIGKVLSCAPIGTDGVWPCEPVRDVMEDIQSEPMMRGAHTGLYNSRGAHWRGEGGDQERELADKYRNWARALQVSHPIVASKLLFQLAETYEREAGREDVEADIRRRLY